LPGKISWDEKARAALAEDGALKGKGLFSPIRAALTGRVEGPELHKVLPLLGKVVILERLRKVLDKKEKGKWG